MKYDLGSVAEMRSWKLFFGFINQKSLRQLDINKKRPKVDAKQ